jgi:hypothetical protein
VSFYCDLDSWIARFGDIEPFRVLSGVGPRCQGPGAWLAGSQGGTYLHEISGLFGDRVVADKQGTMGNYGALEANYYLGFRSSIYYQVSDITVHLPPGKPGEVNFQWTGSNRPNDCSIYNGGKSIWCRNLKDTLRQ